MRLRPATVTDFPFIRALAQHPDNTPFITDEDEAGLSHYLGSIADRLLIAEENTTACGFALFSEIGNPSGRVELRRLALAQTGGGRGRAFVGLLIRYAFEDLGAARIWLDVSGENPRALALYGKMGFTREAVLRQHWFRASLGRAVDMHIFGLLRDEWQGSL